MTREEYEIKYDFTYEEKGHCYNCSYSIKNERTDQYFCKSIEFECCGENAEVNSTSTCNRWSLSV